MSSIDRFEKRVDRLTGYPWLVVLGFTVLYLATVLPLARAKALWEDEFYTLFISSAPNWNELLRALSTGADQTPPSFFYLTHALLLHLGGSSVVLRSPAIFGVWLMCVCLYRIVARLTRPAWGVIAMLLPLTCPPFVYYAVEARGYGLMVGMSALALLAWLLAAGGESRWLYIPLLAVGLAGAVGCQYYAATVAVALGCGELVRTAARRKLDPFIWIALLAVLIPPLCFYGVVRNASRYGAHFWSRPLWSQALDVFPQLFNVTTNIVVGASALALVAFSLWPSRRASEIVPVLPLHIAVAIAAFGALPFVDVALAKYVTHAFTLRYALPATIGVAVLLCWSMYRFAEDRSIIAAALIVFCVALTVINTRVTRYGYLTEAQKIKSDALVLRDAGAAAVAIPDVKFFLRYSFYWPREVARNLVFISNPKLALQYMGQDTEDSTIQAMRAWFPMRTAELDSFLRDNPNFLVYGGLYGGTWLTFELPKHGTGTMLGRYGDQLLLSFKTNPAESAPVGIAPEAVAPSMRVPQTGPPLCNVYLSASSCPTFP